MRLLTTLGLISVMACRTDKSITIQNPAPKADIVSHNDGDVVLEGIPTLFVGSVTDANHTPDQLTTIWYVNGDVVCDEVSPDENGETACELALGLEDTEIILAVRDAENARSEDAIVVSIEPTESPVGQILNPTADGVYYSDQLIEFEALVTDAEDDEQDLTVRWVSTSDGELSTLTTTPNNSGEVVGFGNLTEGQHAIQLFVTDTTGKETQDSVIVDVGPPNSAPLCEILTPVDGDAGADGETVEFTATAEDADVNPDWLTVTWISDKDGEIGTSTPTTDGEIVFTYSDLSVNSHIVTMQVADELGETCTKLVEYTVGTAPSVTINTPIDGSVINEGQPITFNATVQDSEDLASDIDLDWSVNGVSISTQGATSSGGASFTDSTLTYGSYNLVVTATDTDGLTDADQINFTVNGIPSQPTVGITPDPANASANLTANITVDSVDPEGVQVNYTYEWLQNNVVVPAYMTASIPSSATAKGETWKVRVTPNDGLVDGDVGTAEVVIQNTAPTMNSVAITPNSAAYNDSVLTCSGTATDPDETPTMTYQWTMAGGVLGNGSTVDLSFTSAMPTSTVVCTATATDADGGTDGSSTSIVLDNRNPTVTATISANGANNTGVLTCSSTLGDPDGETPTVSYEWFNNSGSLGTANPLQLNPNMGGSSSTIDCVATATDGYGGTATSTASHTITNTPPVVDSITMSPSTIDANTYYVGCNPVSSDIDGDAVTHTYAWYIDGTLQVGETGNVFLESWVPGTEIACRATPNDGTDNGNYAEVSVIVDNTAPVVNSVTLSSSSVYTNDTIAATSVLSDSDASQSGVLTANYEWFVDGASVQNGSLNTLDGVNHFNRDEEVFVVVTPNDGLENGTSLQSASVIVSNTAPVMTSVTVTPDPATAGTDDLTCDAVATDVDGDAIVYTYEWSDSSGVQQTMTEVSDMTDTFLAAGLTEDSWTCEVTPYDGTDYGSSVSDSVTVESGCSSFEFDGSTDRVLISHPNLPSGNDARSISVWAYIETQSDLGNIVSYGNGSHQTTNQRFSLIAENGSGSLRFSAQGNDHFYGTPIGLQAWHHIALTFDGAVLSLYIDGVFENSTNTTLNTDASYPLVVASNTTTRDDEYFNGKIFNISLWNRALSSSEIQSNFIGTEPSGLLANWVFGSTIQDLVGNTTSITNEGGVTSLSCPEEDLDGDGVASWEDCDDNDATVSGLGSGASASCVAESCKTILDDGYSAGDGTYWIDPDGSGVFEAYCDMTTDGGGWTLCASASGNDQALRYGFVENGSAGPTQQYSRDCSLEMETVGVEVLAENFTQNEIQLWSVYQNNVIYGTSYSGSDTSLSHIFDTRNSLSGNVLHGYCNYGNCIGYTNGYSIGTNIGGLAGQHFSLGGHCNHSCNERVIWYSSTVNDRVNMYTR